MDLDLIWICPIADLHTTVMELSKFLFIKGGLGCYKLGLSGDCITLLLVSLFQDFLEGQRHRMKGFGRFAISNADFLHPRQRKYNVDVMSSTCIFNHLTPIQTGLHEGL